MITAGHHSYRKAAGIETGVQAGTLLFHNVDMESDDTDPDDLDVLAPVTEYVSPGPVVECDNYVAPASVIEYMSSATVNEYVAPAPEVTLAASGQQLPPARTTTTDTTDDNFDITNLVHPQFSFPVVEDISPRVVGSLPPLDEFDAPVHNSAGAVCRELRDAGIQWPVPWIAGWWHRMSRGGTWVIKLSARGGQKKALKSWKKECGLSWSLDATERKSGRG